MVERLCPARLQVHFDPVLQLWKQHIRALRRVFKHIDHVTQVHDICLAFRRIRPKYRVPALGLVAESLKPLYIAALSAAVIEEAHPVPQCSVFQQALHRLGEVVASERGFVPLNYHRPRLPALVVLLVAARQLRYFHFQLSAARVPG